MDDRTNSLIVRDTINVIERVKKIVELLDTQTPQVLIEAKIVEVREKYSKNLGLDGRGAQLAYDVFGSSGSSPAGAFGFSSAPNPINATALGMTVQGFKKLSSLNFALNLMEEEQKGKIISSPKIVTQHRKPAKITSTITKNFPILNPPVPGSTFQTITIQQIKAPISLDVTPTVTNEGAIGLKVDISKSSLGVEDPSGLRPPDVDERVISTNVLVENGSTLVLGGLYTTINNESHSGIPFLKDIPIIGWLFRTAYNPVNDKFELLVFLTPRILNQEEAGMVDRSSSTIDNESP
jgi:type IV pilus assembly protein PilQ